MSPSLYPIMLLVHGKRGTSECHGKAKGVRVALPNRSPEALFLARLPLTSCVIGSDVL